MDDDDDGKRMRSHRMGRGSQRRRLHPMAQCMNLGRSIERGGGGYYASARRWVAPRLCGVQALVMTDVSLCLGSARNSRAACPAESRRIVDGIHFSRPLHVQSVSLVRVTAFSIHKRQRHVCGETRGTCRLSSGRPLYLLTVWRLTWRMSAALHASLPLRAQ